MTAEQLRRIHRVRAVQVRLAEADEARARDKAAGETRLAARVAELAAGVGPVAGADGAASLAAAAHFRERLHQSAAAAQARVRVAAAALETAGSRVVDARRDRTAAEKLLARAEAQAAERARAMPEAAGPGRKRHDPC